MKIRRAIILGILLLTSNIGLCQYTSVNGSYTDESGGKKGRLYSVQIDRTKSRTYVTIEVMATRKLSRLNIFYGDNCYITSGDWRSNKCYGELESDGSLKDLSCAWLSYTNNGWGWSDVNKGETRRYTLVFDAIPPGLTSFALVDNGSSCHGYSFSGYTITNPRIGGTSWTESSIKNFADANNDGICGIYEATNNLGYRIGCVKSGNEYQLLYLGCKPGISWWYTGDVQADLRASATAGVFKADWYDMDKTTSSDCYVFFDGSSMTTIINSHKTFYLKMYPTSSTNEALGEETQEWSGSGFALKNGYVVTNYHVVEDAKSINISGINGDYNVSYTASVVATDKVNDLAIVKISDHRFKGFGILPYAINIRMAEVGDDIFVLGYPLTQTMGDEIKLTNGIISSRTGFQGDAALYQITAPLQPGNSGGPLFDSKGNVVGVICAHHKGTENVGYAIKTSYLKNLAESSSLTNIFPTNNTVSTLPLSGQVKKLKRYVYLIKCSSAIERRNNHEQKTRKGQNSYSSTSPVIVAVEKQNIQIETSAHTFRLTKIEVADGYTKLYKKVIPKSYNTWIRSYREEFIEDAITKEKYYLENSSIEIYPERTILNTNSIVEIVETYPALSKSTKYIYINSGERYYSDQRIKIRD